MHSLGREPISQQVLFALKYMSKSSLKDDANQNTHQKTEIMTRRNVALTDLARARHRAKAFPVTRHW